jgi:hypothetical protein
MVQPVRQALSSNPPVVKYVLFGQIIFIIIISQSFSLFFYNFKMKINACFLLVKNTTKYLIAGNLLKVNNSTYPVR